MLKSNVAVEAYTHTGTATPTATMLHSEKRQTPTDTLKQGEGDAYHCNTAAEVHAQDVQLVTSRSHPSTNQGTV